MRFSIAIPQLDYDGFGDSFDAPGLRSYLARAEELGFEGGWVLEQTIGQAPLLAPLELLAYCAACTERLRLGVAVLVTSLHEPLQLASAATTVDRISHGRLDIGVAPGGGARQFAAFGVDKDTFISYFTEGLELMKAAWSDEPRVTFHGRFRDVDDLPIQPKPVQRPHPPIWFGGLAPKALARAVRHGDSFLGAGSSTTEAFAGAVTVVRRELDEQQKDPAHFTIGKRVYLMVDDDAARARERVLAGLAAHLRRNAWHRVGSGVGHTRRRRPRAARGDRRRGADAAAQSGRRRRRREPRADGTPCRRSDSAAELSCSTTTRWPSRPRR